MVSAHPLLTESCLSLKTEQLFNLLTEIENVLIIQDLDGVCMGLVQDPLNRVIDLDYVKATQQFEGHFYVLTNGEHIGKRGVNGIVERAAGGVEIAQRQGFYLPGLAAGGVQWQDRKGRIDHPGVSEAELQFLGAVPERIQGCLEQFASHYLPGFSPELIEGAIDASVLDNVASPTANLNTFYGLLREQNQAGWYGKLQEAIAHLMSQLLQEAAAQGLGDSFFVHYAPNLGRDERGLERLKPFAEGDSGTTDFQFMLTGGVKEAGVVALLNRYYGQRTGTYPLGESFSVRTAPQTLEGLLDLVQRHFDPQWMPVIVGVGDTVTSQVEEREGKRVVCRGGSDRNFLQLVQNIGEAFKMGNVVVYIDSSRGEVKNRRSVKVEQVNGEAKVTENPCDPKDVDDPLTLNLVFAGGHEEYCTLFKRAASVRSF
ncbi:glucosylglycerol 3-phosphatase [Spirulina subsalsa FACHB-351]|uniref:Glucosylglycerol 3-phosphatase n=1 Tax=Spirulina subsalsa FACHB-351 TaxID=234711 RepID=A0ABT3L2A8_9CYAN|nr:glucosylglycerol 3-phosphatase [Spirulina subsalsa]MCW6035638.1 glucosylglycerol 3-phosphatase [Spirulina subsalsa FACHB-351]